MTPPTRELPSTKAADASDSMERGVSFAVPYINAEGKANIEHQIPVIIDRVKRRYGNSWVFIGVSEANFLGVEQAASYHVGSYFVQRFNISGGRTAKIVWNISCQDFAREITLVNRSCRVDLYLTSVVGP